MGQTDGDMRKKKFSSVLLKKKINCLSQKRVRHQNQMRRLRH